MSLTEDQARAARAGASVTVTAGAGTGKTHMLTERYLHHLSAHGLRPLQIVAATFTDRAAGELRGRIRKGLANRPELARYSAELEAAQIGTLHALAGRICREHPEAAGVPFDFAVQEALEQLLWLQRHLPDAMSAIQPQSVRAIPYRTLTGVLSALLADPHSAREALACSPDEWPLLIVEEQERAYRRLAAKPEWQAAVALLRAHSGPRDDKLEIQRAAAVAAVDSFEAGEFTAPARAALKALSRRPGSKKAWPEELLGDLKEACGTVKELYAGASYAFELELGPADDLLREALPALRDAFDSVQRHLSRVKAKERILDFSDLEMHALRALRDPGVREFYRKRWKAFLIDEFQDTNLVQARLLDELTGLSEGGGELASRLTIVGDEKQSIYGFRRADVTVFGKVREEISLRGGETVELATSFRTHHKLVECLNAIVEPALDDLHQPLEGRRRKEPHSGPFVSVHLISEGPPLKQFRQRAEAHLLGELIGSLLSDGTRVHDKASGELQPVRAGDIAVLARTWDTLGPYGEELAARGIPVIHAGGGDLLAQREAVDGTALLRFVADARDDLALAAVLRSPFFAFEDRLLVQLAAGARQGDSSWYQALAQQSRAGRATQEADLLSAAAEVLADLLKKRDQLAPSELLGRADELTGYSAVLANLPGGPRRHADWRGFRDFVRTLERGHEDVFAIVRELRRLASLEAAKVPRPGIEAGDAVSLMSVHNAKGLEWPIVVVPDITGGGSARGSQAPFDPGAGVAFKVLDEDDGEMKSPALHVILDRRLKDKEEDEEKRVLYVALTRARDRVLITGSSEKGGKLELLSPGLAQAGIEPVLVPFEPQMAVPKTPKVERQPAAAGRLLGDAGRGISELPVTALSDYRYCPERFRFSHLRQHPGAGESTRTGARVGELAHIALQRGVRDETSLQRFDEGLEPHLVRKALALANRFRESVVYQTVREGIDARERSLATPLAGVRLVGVADAVGEDFVLDYKTGSAAEGDGHLMQVAIYALALSRRVGYVAYLAEERLLRYESDELNRAVERAGEIVERIRSGRLAATPDARKCSACPFSSICEHSLAPTNLAEADLTGA